LLDLIPRNDEAMHHRRTKYEGYFIIFTVLRACVERRS